MKFYYFDTSDAHGELWEDFDQPFESIINSYTDMSDKERQIDAFLANPAQGQQAEEPVLFVFHISEPRYSSSEYYSLTAELVKQWPDQPIYVLLVTGGRLETATRLIDNEQLSVAYFHALSLIQVDEVWSASQSAAWQAFLQDFQLKKRANWDLLAL